VDGVPDHLQIDSEILMGQQDAEILDVPGTLARTSPRIASAYSSLVDGTLDNRHT
jgi:hypothetical protein